jgi:serine phosphatase RsbU (regulator of sigma subunit)/anti-sigma regulatory factor (Ser/Thr protein kinase)
VADGPFDLCIIDSPTLLRSAAMLQHAVARCDPLYLPILLLAERFEISRLSQQTWRIADDVLLRPLERTELVARIESLLRARRMSLRSKHVHGMYEHEAQVAQRLQEAAVPNAFPHVPNVTFDAFYRPADRAVNLGGDWYDVLRLEDGRVVISIGDVSGSGLQAAVTMGKMRQVLRAVAQLSDNPATLLEAADRTLQADEPDRYVTAFVGIFDPLEGHLTYSSAGHPSPIIRHAGGFLERCAANDVLLGTGMRVKRERHRIACSPGSFLVFYTDGLSEATRDVREGITRIETAVATCGAANVEGPAQRIFDDVAHANIDDDVAILTMTLAEHTADPDFLQFSFAIDDADLARTAQEAFAGALRARHYREEAICLAELIFAELLGNVARHAPGETMVALEFQAQHAVLHVLDRGSGFRIPDQRWPASHEESHRGLLIVQEYAEAFSVRDREGGGAHAIVLLPH